MGGSDREDEVMVDTPAAINQVETEEDLDILYASFQSFCRDWYLTLLDSLIGHVITLGLLPFMTSFQGSLNLWLTQNQKQ